ncbi:MAG: hypothetical protein ACRD47_13910, partial [Nitrososphaeraceae archaeon]
LYTRLPYSIYFHTVTILKKCDNKWNFVYVQSTLSLIVVIRLNLVYPSRSFAAFSPIRWHIRIRIL